MHPALALGGQGVFDKIKEIFIVLTGRGVGDILPIAVDALLFVIDVVVVVVVIVAQHLGFCSGIPAADWWWSSLYLQLLQLHYLDEPVHYSSRYCQMPAAATALPMAAVVEYPIPHEINSPCSWKRYCARSLY